MCCIWQRANSRAEPFLLQPSQQFIVGSLFGWKKASTGFRRFRRAYIEQAKGSGKTPMAGAIGLYCLVADGEPGAEVYAAASMKSQAAYIFRAAAAMWRQSPALTRRLTPSGANPVWNLADLKTGSFFRYISTEEGHSGPLPSCALCDELHEHRDGRMIEMLERGFKSRRQPILFMITNAGSDRNSVCWEEHLHAVRVAAGSREAERDATFVGEIIDDAAFSFVCSLDEGDDPLNDPACWIKANPLLGITMPVEELERAVKQARDLPGKLNNILRLHFCVWTDAEEAWMARPTLEAVLADFDPADHTGEEVFLGLDLSATQDLTALAYIVPTGHDDQHRPTFDAWVDAWTPADTLAERAIRDRAPYDIWAASEEGLAAGDAGQGDRLRLRRGAHRRARRPLRRAGLGLRCLRVPQAFRAGARCARADAADRRTPAGRQEEGGRQRPLDARLQADAGEPDPRKAYPAAAQPGADLGDDVGRDRE